MSIPRKGNGKKRLECRGFGGLRKEKGVQGEGKRIQIPEKWGI